jgi:cytochrome P450
VISTLAAVSSEADLFSDAALSNPYPLWETLRDLGPAVHLTRHKMWWLTRYVRVRAALDDWQSFSSDAGIGLNEHFNRSWASALICLDPPEHGPRRTLFTERLSTQALRPLAATAEARVDAAVEQLVRRGEFDAVIDLARGAPVDVLMEVIGWPPEGREMLLSMAAGWFDSAGPDNARTRRAAPRVESLISYLHDVVRSGALTSSGFGSTLIEAHRRGDLPLTAAVGLLCGYVVAAFDTTINAICSGIWLFAHHPDQWALIRDGEVPVHGAVAEVLRMEAPVQYFSRVTAREVDLGGVVIPPGCRVIHSYGAANRDRRKYPHPHTFDVRRHPMDHLAFGSGVHACAGQGLARMAVGAVFTALANRCSAITVAGQPVRALNNMTRGFAHLPVRLT